MNLTCLCVEKIWTENKKVYNKHLTHTQCPVSNKGFLPVRFGIVTILSHLSFVVSVFIRNWEFEISPSVFVKQIICNLVSSCIVTYQQLTCRNLKVSEFGLRKSTKRSRWLSALEIFHNNSCLLEIWGVEYLDTHAFSPGLSQGRVRWSFLGCVHITQCGFVPG